VTILDNSRLEDVLRPAWVEWVKKRIYRNVDAVLTPASSHAPSYARWGIRPDRIFYGLNVVDNAFFEAGSSKARNELEAVRSRLSLGCPFFLGVGRQVAKKNWLGLLTAYERYRLKAGENAWGLVLVGDGEEHPQLESWVRERGLSGVRFDPFCTQEEVCSYHALARCLILPSFYGETWGLVVNEAMASGLPVLVSRQCGCGSVLVREGENGWTFDPGDGKDMTDALERMAGVSEEKWGQMSERSKQIVAEWGLSRFTQGALEAIDACREVRRGPVSWLDACILWIWNGR
jgi:glycosyltransferase involved in cell wall biosynthesis